MVLDSKIAYAKEAFGIINPCDWSAVEPHQVLALDGVGPATLEHIRIYLAALGLTLKNDNTPGYWQRHLSAVKIGSEMGTRDKSVVSPFVIAVDTREQQPWDFQGMIHRAGSKERPLIVPTETRTLGQGDYSIVGMEHRIAIERKSIEDLYSTLGQGRDRFERELERLARLEVAGVVVEADWVELMTKPPPRSQLPPQSVRGSIIAWSERLPTVHWWLLQGRKAAERHAYWLLDRFYRDYTEASTIEMETKDAGLARSRTADPLFA